MTGEVQVKLEFDKIKNYIRAQTTSTLGSEQVDQLHPYTSVEIIRRELRLVSEMKDILLYDDAFPIDGIRDIRFALRRAEIEGSYLSPSELLDIRSILSVSRSIRRYISARSDKYPYLWEICKSIFVNRVLEHNIDEVVDDGGNIRDDASYELKNLRAEILRRQDHLRRRLYSILKQISEKDYTQDDIIAQRDGRLVIPVKIEHKRHVSGVVHGTSSTGLTVFIEPSEIVEMNNEILQLQFQEQKEIERILRELTEQVRENLGYLHTNLNILSKIDLIYAKAKFAIQVDGNLPEIVDDGPIILNSAMHPILLIHHGRENVVPLDFKLGEGSSTVLVISGPNSGGKTVVLKTVGLLTLMAQSGILIPAKDTSKIRVFKKIFIDIGDEQSVERDLSSFGSHIKNLKTIIEQADCESLVLLDELGSGTDPAEGGALGIAIIEELKRRNSFVIVTTHNSMLKFYAYENRGIECGAMEFDQETLSPTYRLRMGSPGRSYAFEIAKRLGLSSAIIERARENLDSSHIRAEEILSKLEKLEIERKKLVESVRNRDERLRRMVDEYEDKLRDVERERRRVKREALSEMQRIVETARSRIEDAIRRIREEQASRKSIKHAHRVADELRDELHRITAQLEEKGEEMEIKPGDSVKLKNGTEVGEVLQVDGSILIVGFGAVKMRVKIDEVEKVDRAKVRGASSHVNLYVKISTRIDVRGMRRDEAIRAVDKFIDSSFLHGIKRVEIIHGKGTGRLRGEIAEFLKKHPNVRSFRPGGWDEGGDGVTIVELDVD
jgi:DNA mismatch repair protein MutS2